MRRSPSPAAESSSTSSWERPPGVLERRIAWHYDWGEGHRPGLLFLFLNRSGRGSPATWRRRSLDIGAAGAGALLGSGWLLSPLFSLLALPVLAIAWTAVRSAVLMRRLTAVGVLPHLAVTPFGKGGIFRDLHLTVVRELLFLPVGWILGMVILSPVGVPGLVFAGIGLLLLKPVLWRVSVLAGLQTLAAERPGRAWSKSALRILLHTGGSLRRYLETDAEF